MVLNSISRNNMDRATESATRQLVASVRRSHDRHRKLFSQEQQYHFARQLLSCSEACDGEQQKKKIISDGQSLAERLFPSPEVTYGPLYKELSPAELAVFRRLVLLYILLSLQSFKV